ncbi:MAG: DUF1559 domain-containing protein [Planctomycetaceae bacterium]
MRYGRGFTIIELLISIAVVSLLIALFLPAVMEARESSRRMQCLNNLRQIGAALHNYEEQHTRLPPAMIWSGPPGEQIGPGTFPIGLFDRIAKGLAPTSEPDRVHANWVLMLLPHVEQQSLSDKYNFSRPVSDPANAEVRQTPLAVMNCPTDTFNRITNFYSRALLAGNNENLYARGNYGINFGSNRGCIINGIVPCTDGFHVDSNDLANKNMVVWGSGLAGINTSFRFSDVTSGTSHFVVVDELRAGVHPLDPRGTWALGFIAASATARHGLFGGIDDANGPNNSDSSSDDITGCTQLKATEADLLAKTNMPCFAPPDPTIEANDQATSRSQHPGGVQVLLADGSARFVSDNVNSTVWHHIHLRDSSHAGELSF